MKNKQLFFSLVSEFLNSYMPDQIGRSPNTIKSYKDSLTLFRYYINKNLNRSILNFEFNECNRDCLLGFMKYLKERGDIDKTRNSRLTALKAYMYFASDKDISLLSYYLEAKRVPSCKVKKKINPVLTEKGITAILRQPKGNKKGLRNKVFMILLYDTATRIDELLSLKMEDLHLDKEYPYIKVLGKGCKERNLNVTNLCKKHILQYISVYHDETCPNTPYVFYTIIHDNINKISESTVEHFIQQYADLARIKCKEIPKHVHPHMFNMKNIVIRNFLNSIE